MSRKETKARRALLDSAMVLLAHNPGASFIEVAEAAGIGRATLYRHFPRREDLVRTLTLEAIEQTDTATAHIETRARNARDALCMLFEAMIELGDRFYFLTRLPEAEDDEINAHLNRQTGELEQLILWAQQERVIDPDIPTQWATSVVNGLIYAAWEVRGREVEIDKTRLVELSIHSLERGLGVKSD